MASTAGWSISSTFAGWSRVLTESLADPARFDDLRVQARRSVLANYDLKSVCLPRMVALVESLGPQGA
jgi:hypothetical protein